MDDNIDKKDLLKEIIQPCNGEHLVFVDLVQKVQILINRIVKENKKPFKGVYLKAYIGKLKKKEIKETL